MHVKIAVSSCHAVDLLAAVLLCLSLDAAVAAQSIHSTSAVREAKTALPQTTKLEQNDNLAPTVNRTQAMRTEAETGSINPITGATVVPQKAKTTAKSPLPKGKIIYHEY